MKTETLIHDLALQCRPIKPIGHPLKRFVVWALSAVIILVAGVLILRPPPEIWSHLANPIFVFPALVMLCISLVCTLSAFVLSVPDEQAKRFDKIPIAAVIFLLGLMIYMSVFSNLDDVRPDLICVFRITGLALAPGALLFYMLKRAAPMRSWLIGLLAALGSLAFAEIGLQFICRKSILWTHVLVWHFMPVCILALTGIAVGHLMFKWTTGLKS